MTQSIDELAATAYHEAGHAVMAWALGRNIHKVTIIAGRTPFGLTKLGACELQKGRHKPRKDTFEDEVLILLAGMVAEARYTGAYCPKGANEDLKAVESLLCSRANSQKQHEKLHRRLLGKTEHLLEDDVLANAVKCVADELIRRKTISGRTVRHLFEESERRFS